MNRHRINVLIVGYDSERWLPACLSTLKAASSSRIQLCFVDNHNNPGLQTFDFSAFDLEVLQTPHPMGFADANNFGIQRTEFESEFTVFLNQDTVSTPLWIDDCVACFRNDPKLGILSPGLRTYDLSDWEPNLAACVCESGLTDRILEAEADKHVELQQVTAAAMMIRTDVLDQVGPFDPIFGSYYEDYDLCRRVRNAGYKVAVCAAARVGHFSGSVTSTRDAERRRTRRLIRNRLIHKVRENAGGRLSVLAKHFGFILPRNLIRGLLKTESSQPVSATIGAHWDLLWIIRRLLSASNDNGEFERYCAQFYSDREKLHNTPHSFRNSNANCG